MFELHYSVDLSKLNDDDDDDITKGIIVCKQIIACNVFYRVKDVAQLYDVASREVSIAIPLTAVLVCLVQVRGGPNGCVTTVVLISIVRLLLSNYSKNFVDLLGVPTCYCLN